MTGVDVRATEGPQSRGFATYVGPIDGGAGVFSFTVAPHHLNGGDRLHGGMMMSFASIALGDVAAQVAGGARVAPLSINCDFVSAGEPDDTIEAVGEVTRRTRTVLFISATLRARGRVLMTATAVYKVMAGEEA